MHANTCNCRNCCARRDALMPLQRFAFPREPARLLSEEQEVELALELLAVSSEQELDQFLGKVFRGIGRGLKKVGSVAGKILKPLGGALKGLAKKALPLVGGALGSFIPIPGVGTALGTALGSAVSKALEMEAGVMEQEEAEFEMARRFVRIAADATQQALAAGAGGDAETVVQEALLEAVRANVPGLDQAELEAQLMPVAGETAFAGNELEEEVHYLGPYGGEGRAQGGRWRRRGRHIVLTDM